MTTFDKSRYFKLIFSYIVSPVLFQTSFLNKGVFSVYSDTFIDTIMTMRNYTHGFAPGCGINQIGQICHLNFPSRNLG